MRRRETHPAWKASFVLKFIDLTNPGWEDILPRAVHADFLSRFQELAQNFMSEWDDDTWRAVQMRTDTFSMLPDVLTNHVLTFTSKNDMFSRLAVVSKQFNKTIGKFLDLPHSKFTVKLVNAIVEHEWITEKFLIVPSDLVCQVCFVGLKYNAEVKPEVLRFVLTFSPVWQFLSQPLDRLATVVAVEQANTSLVKSICNHISVAGNCEWIVDAMRDFFAKKERLYDPECHRLLFSLFDSARDIIFPSDDTLQFVRQCLNGYKKIRPRLELALSMAQDAALRKNSGMRGLRQFMNAARRTVTAAIMRKPKGLSICEQLLQNCPRVDCGTSHAKIRLDDSEQTGLFGQDAAQTRHF